MQNLNFLGKREKLDFCNDTILTFYFAKGMPPETLVIMASINTGRLYRYRGDKLLNCLFL
jgi:hypothetical protein